MTNAKLLPCPFCGSTDIGHRQVKTYSLDSSYGIFGCRSCGAHFEAEKDEGPTDGDFAEWNRRSPTNTPAPASEAADVEPVAHLHVPGEFRCKKCGFTLSQFTLRASDAAIGWRDQPGERCPNDGAPLWRVTWEERAAEHYERAIEEMHRANEAESTIRLLKERLAEAEKLLEPFADIADLVDAETEGLAETDEFQLLFHDYLLATWQLARFRRTRAFLTKHKEGQS